MFQPRRRGAAAAALTLAATALVLSPTAVLAHGEDPRFHPELPFRSEQISRSFGLGRSLGLRARPEASTREVGERTCIVTGLAGFDVDDDFAFDIDERVELEVEIDAATSPASFLVAHDQSGSTDSIQEVRLPANAKGLVRVPVTLERARFAGRGSFGTDLGLAVPRFSGTLTICGLELGRSGSTPEPASWGRLTIRVLDAATGEPTAARMGVYDQTGRSPLPGGDAVPLEHFYERVRMVAVRDGSPWPVPNRWVFYVDGRYSARLPAGSYDLVAGKGIEYRIARRRVVVEPDADVEVRVPLQRWAEMPKRGWYAGDAHIHISRRPEDDSAILAQMAAEDLHVANLLQVGNVSRTWFPQYAWGDEGRYRQGDRVLVSGQEDPTTGHRGHTLLLNLKRPVRDPDRYFLYHLGFDAAHRQGGVAGYAHLPAGWFHVERGLALDAPHGVVDFVEVLQIGLCDVEIWYPLLNLGFKLAPSAGSDFPYVDLPGTVRNYVDIGEDFSPEAWYEGLRAGRTFVTNGPLLELSVNGRGMGSELEVSPGTVLEIEASATMNPDIDRLVRLELVVHGEVAASAVSEEGVETLSLSHQLTADEGLWLAVRALGAFEQDWNTVVAHSAPIYVSVDGDRSWNRGEVERLVARQLEHLDALAEAPLEPREDLMFWDTAETMVRRWKKQRPLLAERLAETRKLYRALLAAAKAERSDPEKR